MPVLESNRVQLWGLSEDALGTPANFLKGQNGAGSPGLCSRRKTNRAAPNPMMGLGSNWTGLPNPRLGVGVPHDPFPAYTPSPHSFVLDAPSLLSLSHHIRVGPRAVPWDDTMELLSICLSMSVCPSLFPGVLCHRTPPRLICPCSNWLPPVRVTLTASSLPPTALPFRVTTHCPQGPSSATEEAHPPACSLACSPTTPWHLIAGP